MKHFTVKQEIIVNILKACKSYIEKEDWNKMFHDLLFGTNEGGSPIYDYYKKNNIDDWEYNADDTEIEKSIGAEEYNESESCWLDYLLLFLYTSGNEDIADKLNQYDTLSFQDYVDATLEFDDGFALLSGENVDDMTNALVAIKSPNHTVYFVEFADANRFVIYKNYKGQARAFTKDAFLDYPYIKSVKKLGV